MAEQSANDEFQLLVQPDAGAAPLIKAIRDAKRTVEIVIFRFDDRELENALSAAVTRAVDVHALIAHVNGSGDNQLRKLELRLLEKGITVARTDNGLVRYHGKLLIIDREKLFVLGFNFTQRDLRRTRSFGVITRNPKLVEEAAKLFDADTKRQPYEACSPAFVVSPVNARAELADFISGTKNELFIYDPKIGDPQMIGLLEELSKQKKDVRIIGRVARQSSGICSRALKMRLHTRTMIRDRKTAFIGSQSLRTMELDNRREVGLIFRDETAVKQLVESFERDWDGAIQIQSGLRTVSAVKLSKRVAKAIANELPPVAPVVSDLVKEIAGQSVQLAVDPEEIEIAVRNAIKHAVKDTVKSLVEETSPI